MPVRPLLIALVLALPLPAVAGVPLVELKTADGSARGRVAAKNDRTAMLLDRDGSLRRVPLDEVVGYAVAEPTFRPYAAVDMRDRLRRLVAGNDIDVIATPHFVVVGRRGPATAVAETLEEVYDGFRWYCSTRNLGASHPEFPLVAIVFPTRDEFEEYCRAENVTAARSLRGYYHHLTNRFVCYETCGAGLCPISADLTDTVVHEAAHQIASNTGLHPRGGDLPTWVAEGLATALEPEGARRPLRSEGRPLDRANPERLEHFLAHAGEHGLSRTHTLVAHDAAFEHSTLDAYATAWALTFYLMETKPAAYGRYLRGIAARDPLAAYRLEDRLADFESAFGKDWKMLDSELVRFHKRVAAGERR